MARPDDRRRARRAAPDRSRASRPRAWRATASRGRRRARRRRSPRRAGRRSPRGTSASSSSRAASKRDQGLKRPKLRRRNGKATIAWLRRANSPTTRRARSKRSGSRTPKTAPRMTASVIASVWGRSANGVTDRPRLHLAVGHLAHQGSRSAGPLAVEGRQQELALAHVAAVVERQQRARANRGLEHRRVGLPSMHLRRVAREDRLDERGIRHVDAAAEAWEGNVEDVAWRSRLRLKKATGSCP